MTTSRLPYGGSPPESWAVVPLKYLTTLTNGYVFNSADWVDAGTSIIRIENLNGSQNFNRSGAILPSRYRVKSGDLLFSWSGNPGTSFGPYLWTEPGDYYLNQHIFKMGVSGCDARWLYWVLKAATHWIERELTSGMIGMVHVTKEELASVPIPVPPLELQRRIADFLDAETARIDKLVRLRSEQSALIGEGLAAEAVDLTGRSRIRRGGGTTEGMVQLRRAAMSTQTGSTPGDLHDLSDGSTPENSLPWYTPAAIDSWMSIGATEKAAHRDGAPLFPAGSVVITGIGESLGKVAYLNHAATGNQQLTVITPQAGVSGKFMAWQLWAAEQEIREWAQYSRIRIINNDSLKSFPIYLPSHAEQEKVVRTLDSHMVRARQITDAFLRFQGLADERRQALITAAVTGQLDVSSASGRNVTDGVTA